MIPRAALSLVLLLLSGAAPGRAGEVTEEVRLGLGAEEGFGGGYRLSVAPDGAVFVLDRTGQTLYRVDPETGEPLWQVDGSQAGEPFLDPSCLSLADGFYVYLTDRGSRRIWRIDRRGELRGSMDISFAVDPMILELVSGRQMAVLDRADGTVHLLDDSGRLLWSFRQGGGEATGDPVDLAVSADGKLLHLLWTGPLEVMTLNIFGRSATTVSPGEHGNAAHRIEAVAGSDGAAKLVLASADGALRLIDRFSGREESVDTGLAGLHDLRAVPGEPGTLLILAGEPPRLVKFRLEKQD